MVMAVVVLAWPGFEFGESAAERGVGVFDSSVGVESRPALGQEAEMTLDEYIKRRMKELGPPYLAAFELNFYQQRMAELRRLQEALQDGTIDDEQKAGQGALWP